MGPLGLIVISVNCHFFILLRMILPMKMNSKQIRIEYSITNGKNRNSFESCFCNILCQEQENIVSRTLKLKLALKFIALVIIY